MHTFQHVESSSIFVSQGKQVASFPVPATRKEKATVSGILTPGSASATSVESAAARASVWATAGVLAFVLVVFPLAGRAGAIPYVGVDTWYAYGLNVDEQTVIHLANAVVRRGLKAVGYQYVWIDAGWWKPTAGPGTPGARDAAGDIELDAAQWPHGLRWLSQHIHSLGLEGRHLYRRWSGRVRKRRQLGSLSAGHRPVRHVDGTEAASRLLGGGQRRRTEPAR